MRRLLHPDLWQVTLDRALSALGDPVRLSIVRTLADGNEHLRGDFEVEVGASTLSHHTKTLREAGVVRSRGEGTRCFFSLRPEFEDRFPGLLGVILDQPAETAWYAPVTPPSTQEPQSTYEPPFAYDDTPEDPPSGFSFGE